MAKTGFENLRVYQLSEQIGDLVWEAVIKWDRLAQDTVGKQLINSADSVGANTCPVKQLEVKVHYTYLLQSIKDKDFYTGSTKNLKLRFEQHSKGLVESTKDRRPLKLIYYEACLTQEDATRREKYLKTYNGKRFLKRRLKSYLTG